MVDIDIVYQGELRCQAVHRPSTATVTTDPPVDNHGRGGSFSPTDLVATALGTCMLTIMGIRAGEHGWNLEGTRVHVKKSMTKVGPRRIADLATHLTIPNSSALTPDARAVLEQAALTCPVRLSLSDAIDVPVTFDWQG